MAKPRDRTDEVNASFAQLDQLLQNALDEARRLRLQHEHDEHEDDEPTP